MSRKKVFLSHTSELSRSRGGRSFVQAALDGIRQAECIGVEMGDFPASAQSAAEICSDNVRQCEVYIGVLGFRYGSFVRSQEQISYTELEYRSAALAGIPRLMFLLRESDSLPDEYIPGGEEGARQARFRNDVLNENAHTCAFFESPDQLHHEIYKALLSLNFARDRDSSGKHSAGVSTSTIRAALLAPLKPYMANRKSQEAQIDRVIESSRDPDTNQYHGPVALIIHGSDGQGHERFVSRLKESQLPRIYQLNRARDAVHDIFVNFPRDVPNDAQALSQSLLSRLAKQILHEKATLSESLLIEHLRRQPRGPLLIRTQLLTSDLNAVGIEKLMQFLRFWDELSYQPMPQAPVVCICVKYMRRKGYRGWGLKRRNAALRTTITRLQDERYRKARVMVLPELQDLHRSHVEDWLAEEFKDDEQDELRPKVRELFSRVSTIGMEEFATLSKRWAQE